jgi:SAM-dependent methyltransferase
VNTSSSLPQEDKTGAPRNPDFDDGRVVWDDAYSGQYDPVPYDAQFDGQWKLYLEKQVGFYDHTGVETTDPYIDDRIFELTGVQGVLARRRWKTLYPLISAYQRLSGMARRRDIGGRLILDPKFPLDYFRDKKCLDIGCGAGRWTRTLQELGGQVYSADVSEHALRSTRRFNPNTHRLDIFSIDQHPELVSAFDFTLCWGVVMCTHDPRLAFERIAATVAPGGSLYVMVYAPTYHSSDEVREWRRHYHRDLKTPEARIGFLDRISQDNLNKINYLDMLNTFYNWTIPENVVHDWFSGAGFVDVTTLNAKEAHNCAWHVLGRKP